MTAPPRMRVAMDALALTAATAFAFVFRAGVRDYDSLGPGHLLSLIVPALPFVVPLGLLALWTAGLYDADNRDRGMQRLLAVAATLAWAAALLAFVAVYWGKGPDAPMIVMAVGYPAAVAAVVAGRHLLDARAPAAVRG